MRWSINENGVNSGESFDDGILEPAIYEGGPGPGPGEEGFTRAGIDAELARRKEAKPSSTWAADYIDRNWPVPSEE